LFSGHKVILEIIAITENQDIAFYFYFYFFTDTNLLVINNRSFFFIGGIIMPKAVLCTKRC